MKVSLGMFTVFEALQKDFAQTIKRVAELGYDGIEMYGEIPCPAKELRSILEENGVEISGWHVEWRHLQPNTIEETLAYHKVLGTPYLIIPALGGPWNIGHTQAEDCAEVWHRHAQEINRVIERAEKEGFSVGYHTHAHEFENCYENAETPYRILLSECPRLIMELDTGTCIEDVGYQVLAHQYAGNAAKLVHDKPYSQENAFNERLGSPTDETPLAAVVSACFENKAEWIVAECEPDPGTEVFGLAQACCTLIRDEISQIQKNVK